tara:strand:- start:315 stop:485 length:171 start_codon:yes stop_codon:yes gene_type:complete
MLCRLVYFFSGDTFVSLQKRDGNHRKVSFGVSVAAVPCRLLNAIPFEFVMSRTWFE